MKYVRLCKRMAYVIHVLILLWIKSGVHAALRDNNLTVSVFLPLTCSSNVNLYLRTLNASILEDSRTHDVIGRYNITFDLVNSCEDSPAISELVTRSSSDFYKVIIGPGQASLCEPAYRLTKAASKSLVSPGCSNPQLLSPYSAHFVQAVPSSRALSDALNALFLHFKWKYLAVVFTDEQPWQDYAKDVYFTLTNHGFTFRNWIPLPPDFNSSTLHNELLSPEVKGKTLSNLQSYIARNICMNAYILKAHYL